MPLASEKLTEIKLLQDEFHKRLVQQGDKLKSSPPAVLKAILEVSQEVVECCLGDFGLKLKEFADKVDLNHPGLHSIFEGLLADESDFSHKCQELLRITDFGIKFSIKNYYRDIFVKFSENIISNFRSLNPKNNRVRFLKTRKERDLARLNKRSQAIDLTSFCRKGVQAWNNLPSSFNCFLRFDRAYHEDLQKAQKKAKRFEGIGCESLKGEVLKSIDIFEKQIKDNYFGFNRITITNAAIILAKFMGCRFIPDNGVDKIFLRRSNFRFNFDCDYDPIESRYLVGDKGFVYEPRICPLHEIWELVSPNIKTAIDHLDKFPENNGKAIFDHFAVVIPGVDHPKSPYFLDSFGFLQKYEDVFTAKNALDKILIQDGSLAPILLGEKDGKCYFICFLH